MVAKIWNGSSKGKRLFVLFCLLVASFASYDLAVLCLGNAPTLLSVRVYDSFRIDESYMYVAGVGKTIFFDPYLKEHAASLTLRPPVPTMLFAAIYWLCGRSLNLAILVGHTVPPLVSCLLLYLVGMRLTGSRSWAIFAMLLAAGQFVFSALTLVGAMVGGETSGLAGPDLYLLQQLLGDRFPLGHMMPPIQFTRLFSPSLTLPFLLFPLWLLLRGGTPAARGAAIAANLYVYPHHVIVLGLIEIAFWLRDRRLPGPTFFVAGMLACVPYVVLHALVERAGTYADIYSRVGQARGAFWWFFVPFLAIITALAVYGRRKDVEGIRLAFTGGCLASAILIYAVDHFFKFPQVHLVGLRIFAFLGPLALACALKDPMPRIAAGLNVLLLALIGASQAYAGWTHRHEFADFPADGFPSELSRLPAGSVVMTDVQYEVPYISAVSDKYSYLAYGIVSAASNEELLRRFAVVARIYGWSADRLHGGDWDGPIPIYVWIYHVGPPKPVVRNAAIDAAIRALGDRSACELLQIYRVDYIRFRQAPPAGLQACTAPATAHILRVIPPQ